MESGNKTSDIDSDGEQNIDSFTKLSLDPPIDTDKENEVTSIFQASNHKQREKLTKLLTRYTENKDVLIRNARNLYKVSSILRRDKRKTICFEEYSKLTENKYICEGDYKSNRINISLPQEINTMKKLSKFSVEELEYLRIRIESNCENEDENIEEFLLSFGSTQIKCFIFRGLSIRIENKSFNSKGEYSSYYEVSPCSDYFCCLRDVMSKTAKYICIKEILLNSQEFSAILRAAKHVERLHFTDCKILTDGEHDLGQMEECQVEYLEIGNFIHVCKNSRDYEDSCMKIFLSIVGCTNLLRSLRKIEFDCGEKMKKKLLSKAKEILGNDYDILMPSFKCF